MSAPERRVGWGSTWYAQLQHQAINRSSACRVIAGRALRVAGGRRSRRTTNGFNEWKADLRRSHMNGEVAPSPDGDLCLLAPNRVEESLILGL